MKFLLVLLLAVASSLGAYAQQSHFGRLHPPASYKANYRPRLSLGATAPDSVFSGWRIQGPSIVYAYGSGSSSVMTGVGYGYEHDTWKASTGTWYTNWSIAPTIYGGGTVAPSSINGVAAVGAQVTLLNRYLTFGGGYNFVSKGAIAVLGISFDIFNN